jgi:hypothetical protein
MEVGTKQGKTPIFVKDVAGFYVNRCLSPFMTEVTALVLEGVELEFLDQSMTSFGMPVGPITLSGFFVFIFCCCCCCCCCYCCKIFKKIKIKKHAFKKNI